MEFRLLGPFEIDTIEPVSIPRKRERSLLAVLLLELGRSVSTDRLAELLWDGVSPPTAETTLRSHISRLRSTLPPADVRIIKHGQGYLLRTDPDRVDAHRFRSMVAHAHKLVEPDRRAAMLRSALELWRGPVLADIATDTIRDRLTASLEELRLEVLDQRISDDLTTGRHRDLVGELRELVATHPIRERFAGHLMLALYRSGRLADALAVYEDSRRYLDSELGLTPGAELRTLHERMLRGDSALDLAERVEIAAAPPPARTLRQLPHDIAHFTGRERELAELDAVAATGREAQALTIVSIDGAPGIGKTTLAVHWAHRIALHYPDIQLHLNLRGYGRGEPVTPTAAAESILRSLGVDRDAIPPGVEERSALVRSTLAGRQVLLLLDNARDAEQVRPLLPGTGSLVIVTSRNQLRGLTVRDGAHRVTLQRPPADQAVELLTAAIGLDRVAAEPAAAARLVELCDHIPLAIAIVAERADRSGSLTEVVNALEDEKARLDNLGTGEDDPHTDLRAALSWSYRAFSTDAAAMFRMLGVHPANDITVEAAAALADLPVPRAKASLDQLHAAHLVEQHKPHRYELHDLMRLYATEAAHRQDSCPEHEAAARRVLDWYLHAAVSADTVLYEHRRRDFVFPYEPQVPPPKFGSLHDATTWFEQEYDSLKSVATWAAAKGWVGYTWRIALACNTYFDRAIPWHDCLAFLEATAEAAESGGDHVGEAYVRNSIGSMLANKGDLEAATIQIEQSLQRFKHVGHIRGQAMTMANLGLVYGELGYHYKAKPHTTRALELCEELGYRRGIALNLDNLGVIFAVAGDYKQAVECHLQAAAISRQLGDLTADAMNQHHLGSALAGLGDIPGAARAFRISITTHRQLGGKRWAASALADFGKMLGNAGHPVLARGMLENALQTMIDFADQRAGEVKAVLAAL